MRPLSTASSRSALFLVASSSVVLCSFRFLQWRARKRAKDAADRARGLLKEGPMINVEDESEDSPRVRILNNALRRASKWLSFRDSNEIKPFIGQVGGISTKRRPCLRMLPDYVLKALHSDHRGYREVAFYEALKLCCQPGLGHKNAAAAMAGEDGNTKGSITKNPAVLEAVDVLAMWLAIFLHDSSVAASEATLVSSWRESKREIDLLRRLANFTAPYYGVVKHNGEEGTYEATPTSPASEIGCDSYLLLHDLTSNYSKPCVIDIKVGTQTYEPDATEEKRTKEYTKYAQMTSFGFRIVGMRIYDPTHAEADERGFRTFSKAFGKSLKTREEVLDALRTFFSAGLHSDPNAHKFRTRAVTNVMMKLRLLRRWFEDNKTLCFYASSLLLVYEGGVSPGGGQDMTTMKMIDLGRVRREAGGDHGYKFGLRSLTSMLSELMENEGLQSQ